MKIFIGFGTRPEAIKMAPVIKEIKKRKVLDLCVCVTAQHREMLDQILNFFSIVPDYDLELMRPGQDPFYVTARALCEIKTLLEKEKPDIVLVQGDTTTAFAIALAAFYLKIPVGHVEAGLRTYDKYKPFPEEINRHLIGVLADYHFAPTRLAGERLIHEGIAKNNVFVTGNTVIDALLITIRELKRRKVILEVLRRIDPHEKLILVTGHRRESFGKGLQNICQALLKIARRNPEVEIVYPVHLNPNVQGPVRKILADQRRIHLIEPLDYIHFVYLMSHCYLILTDSGGIQEEAPSLGKPVLVLREVTERPEAIEAGTAKLVGIKTDQIVQEAERLIYSKTAYREMIKPRNPYGDGSAAKRIVNILKRSKRSLL